MFVTLRNVESGVPIKLAIPIDNVYGHRRVAVREVFYKITKINVDSTNNWFIPELDIDGQKIYIYQGYYNLDELNEAMFNPHGINFRLNPATQVINVTTSKSFYLPPSLAKTFGFDNLLKIYDINDFDVVYAVFFSVNTEGVKMTQHADKPVDKPFKFSLHSYPLYMHLAELKTTTNSLASPDKAEPFDLLRVIPPNDKMFNFEQFNTFTSPQYKELEEGFFETLCVTIKDTTGNVVKCDNLDITLEITCY